MSSTGNSVGRALSLLIGVLVVSAIYLYAFPQANVLYAGVVLLHVVAGVIASVLLLVWLVHSLFSRQADPLVRAGIAFLFLGAIPGLVLIYTGALRSNWNIVYVHLGLSFVGAGLIAAARIGWLSRSSAVRVAAVLVVLAVLAPAARYLRETRWTQHARIENPALPPLSMNGEGDGPTGPFFPSSAQVYGGEKIPSKFFMESDSCKRATKISTTSGTARPIIFRRSTISGIASRSSTCKTPSAPSPPNGVADAMIPPFSTPERWIGRSKNLSTPLKPRPDWAA